MSLPAAWVDHLFAKLATRYGAEFSGKYRDIDPALVKADWAEVLNGLSGDAIALGLRSLPNDKAPNAMQFRALCFISAPPAFAPALPAPKADIGRVKQLVGRLSEKPTTRRTMAQECIENIHAASKRAPLTAGQRHVLACCEAITGVNA